MSKSARSPFCSLALPFAAVGLAALLPLRAAPLIGKLQAAAPTLPPLVLSRPGLRATEVLAPTLAAPLAGSARPGPVGEDRPADGRLLAEVARRQAELDRREQELETRATQIEAASQLARQQIAELARMRAEIEKLVVHETAAANGDLDSLVGLYANMKPPQAAAVLAKLDPSKAAAILQKLDTRAAGPILAAMDPAAALAITEEVAQRRAAFRR
ncbi:conserved protein of unknown function (plasmid) [Rhodovastum atsumiense]|uniref:MotE family protein n=1 Tax=Rhodovastum atsumiense TaxID=504468 RepID=UPI002024BD4D|nr:hypothetical protein [Rhodovastum atsumiense]CAH2605536.1 conserved protein of unknown function [Rhodovastum atsumiense]